MQIVAQYRRNAQDCRDLAARARDSMERVTLLRMAETWDGIANDRLASRPQLRDQDPNPVPEPAGGLRTS